MHKKVKLKEIYIYEGANMIRIEDLSFKYRFTDNILENVNLEINQGEIIVIVGRNGSGKSTLAKLISGILIPKKGCIFIDNIDTKNKKTKLELRKKIGILFQNPENQIIFPIVKDDLEFALKNLKLDNKEKRIQTALEQVGMSDFYDKETYGLSLGQKQRINIAGLLAVDNKYIVMDEPTTMIDTLGKEKIHDIIMKLKEKGYTFVIVTNNPDEILLGDKIVIIENKGIKKVIKREELIDNIGIFNECEVKMPDTIKILLKLKEKGIDIHKIKDYRKKDLLDKIVEVMLNGRK